MFLVAKVRLLATENAEDVAMLVECFRRAYERGIQEPETTIETGIGDPLVDRR
jgi:hypothetical protein